MLKIGEFSILSSISIHMLRHYDEIGLLIPNHVDSFTGYRYYYEDQLLTANQILVLKSMGFGLKAIAQILKEQPDDEQIRRLLEAKLEEKVNEIRTLQFQREQLINTLREFGNKNIYNCRIAVKLIPKRHVVSFRMKVADYSEEGILWIALYEECKHLNVEFSSLEYNIAILHEVNEEEHWVDIEVQKTVDRFSGKSEKVSSRTVAAEKVASLIFQGGYNKLKDVNASVAKWIIENHYEINGNLFNIYHISPECTKTENEFVTEVCFPIKDRSDDL